MVQAGSGALLICETSRQGWTTCADRSGGVGLVQTMVGLEQAATMIRQHVLTGTDPLNYEVILSEAVLRCPVGGNRVMRGQLERLLELTGQPNITVQVVPFTAGSHPGMEGRSPSSPCPS